MTEDKSVPRDGNTEAAQARKDRAYSPSSERETEHLQDEPTVPDPAGGGQLPGTGGPDDSGDVGVPDDEIDAAVIRARSDPEALPTAR